MQLPRLRRGKITFLFLLGVGIPSIFLGYLAFRGIRNDQALLEQQRLNEHRRVVSLVTNSMQEAIGSVERAFARSVAKQSGRERTIPTAPGLVAALDSFKQQHPLAEEVFYFAEPETVRLPIADLLFLPDGSLERVTSLPQSSFDLAELQAGERLEIQEQDYRQAMASYRTALARTSNGRLSAHIRVAIARVQRKARRIDEAVMSYETLLEEHANTRTTGGLTVGLIACAELGALHLASGDSLAALDALLELYEHLVHGTWALERAQYEYFAEQARGSIATLVSDSARGALQAYRDAYIRLTTEEQERRAVTVRLLTFQASAASAIQARLAREESSIRESRRFPLDVGGQSFLLSLSSDADRADGTWGLLLDSEYLGHSVLARALEQHLDPTTGQWLLRGQDGRVFLPPAEPPSGAATVNATLAGNFPPWLIELYPPATNPYAGFFTTSRSLYFYMFVLIAAILVFGLILTVRAVSHELELARLKSDFVSTVSHEFKSPLTSIRQLAEMLQAGRVPSEERRRRYYDVLVEQSARLSSLVTNILDVARIEEGRKDFRFEAVDVGELVHEVVSAAEHQWRHEGFVVRAELEHPLPVIQADRSSIAQAISNLIDNAVKYSGDMREVNVRSHAGDGLVTITVEDRGVGIKEEERERVFERFYRGGDALTRSIKGSGLGLTLVQQIVEAHHGSVQAESRVGRGSTFSITLPIHQERDDE
jgi:signal transduction histidine kinase